MRTIGRQLSTAVVRVYSIGKKKFRSRIDAMWMIVKFPVRTASIKMKKRWIQAPTKMVFSSARKNIFLAINAPKERLYNSPW